MFGRKKSGKSSAERLRCSFCNKEEHDVRKLIAGPTVFICDECVEVCKDIIADDAAIEADRAANSSAVQLEPESEVTDREPCLICGRLTVSDDALIVEERGVICLSCGEGVQTALAERKL